MLLADHNTGGDESHQLSDIVPHVHLPIRLCDDPVKLYHQLSADNLKVGPKVPVDEDQQVRGELVVKLDGPG